MLGDRIRNLRTEKAVTQEMMANTIGISPQAISKWELNTTMPDIAMLIPIADYFGVTVDYLLRETKSAETINPEHFVDVVSRKDRNTWRCTVRNISDRELAQVRIKTYFYDKDGNTIDYRDNLVFDLEPNTVKSELLYSPVGMKAVALKIVVKSIRFANE